MTSLKPWVELSRETIFQKYGHRLDKVIFRLPSGAEADYYVTGKNGRTVCVFALTIDNQVILVKQFRPGPQKFLSELPGGAVNQDENPQDAIKREFLEESGYTGDFEFVTESIHNAYSAAVCCHFVATNCHKISEPQNSETEMTEVVLMSLKDFKKHLKSGQLSDIATGYYGLEHLNLL